MTESQVAPPAPPSAQPPAPAPAGPSPLTGALASLSKAELFIAGGAALIVLTDLVFVIFGPYGFSNVIWAAAAVALIAALAHNRMPASLAASYEWLLVGLAAVAVLLGIRQVVFDVVFIATPPAGLSVVRLLGMIGLYVGLAGMAWGAWQLWRSRAG